MDKKKYYTVEITYKCGEQTKLHRITNLDQLHFDRLRENMFISGVYRRIDNDTGEILSPWTIIETMVYLQAHFFQNAPNALHNPNSKHSPKK